MTATKHIASRKPSALAPVAALVRSLRSSRLATVGSGRGYCGQATPSASVNMQNWLSFIGHDERKMHPGGLAAT